MEDIWGHNGIVQRDAPAIDAHAAQMVDDHGFMGKRATRAAILLRRRGAQEACLARLQPDIAVDMLLLGPLLRMRKALPLEELAGLGIEDHEVFRHPRGPFNLQHAHRIPPGIVVAFSRVRLASSHSR